MNHRDHGERTPLPSSEDVRARMSRQRRRDTSPELAVRQTLHSRGIRYRVDMRPEPDLRCRADIVWKRRRIAVFIDGCFWHSCPIHATQPKSNREWWERKLEANVRRDLATDAVLRSRGWTVLRFWEHEDPSAVANVVCEYLERSP
ncbi:very short patch repair endonuclease [Mycobacterium sp. E136]|uniref:very short patch repair endonuclease n=1 Tax=Mycobacterium sp. E136 TaxID=1834125 RepID=UPI002571232F|nr:very short patch repair endonuclease [Mycobacterium sp. E136]